MVDLKGKTPVYDTAATSSVANPRNTALNNNTAVAPSVADAQDTAPSNYTRNSDLELTPSEAGQLPLNRWSPIPQEMNHDTPVMDPAPGDTGVFGAAMGHNTDLGQVNAALRHRVDELINMNNTLGRDNTELLQINDVLRRQIAEVINLNTPITTRGNEAAVVGRRVIEHLSGQIREKDAEILRLCQELQAHGGTS